MAPCNGFHPTHQAQLSKRFGGPHGGVNCVACAAGMVGEADTCGDLLFTGAQVRAATNEPDPDPKSPGLNLDQVEAALRTLSHGRIDLDTRKRYPFDKLKDRLTNGAQAVALVNRGVLVEAGQGHGSNGFRGAHGIAIGADNGVPWIDDPLTRRFVSDWETLKNALGRLALDDHGTICGIGKAYVSFSRDITQAVTAAGPGPEPPAGRASVRPRPGEEKRPFGLYTVQGRTVTSARTAKTGGFSAECSRARLYTWPGHTSQSLVVILSGFLADRGRDQGVTFAIRSGYAPEV